MFLLFICRLPGKISRKKRYFPLHRLLFLEKYLKLSCATPCAIALKQWNICEFWTIYRLKPKKSNTKAYFWTPCTPRGEPVDQYKVSSTPTTHDNSLNSHHPGDIYGYIANVFVSRSKNPSESRRNPTLTFGCSPCRTGETSPVISSPGSEPIRQR
jgi:hypothetical protein